MYDRALKIDPKNSSVQKKLEDLTKQKQFRYEQQRKLLERFAANCWAHNIVPLSFARGIISNTKGYWKIRLKNFNAPIVTFRLFAFEVLASLGLTLPIVNESH